MLTIEGTHACDACSVASNADDRYADRSPLSFEAMLAITARGNLAAPRAGMPIQLYSIWYDQGLGWIADQIREVGTLPAGVVPRTVVVLVHAFTMPFKYYRGDCAHTVAAECLRRVG